MKATLIVTMLACLLALGGCLTVPETLADSDGSVGDHPESNGQAGAGVGGAAGGVIGGEGGGVGVTGGVGGGVIGGEGAAGGVAGAAGEAFGTGGFPGVGGCAGGEAGATGGVGGEAFGTGGAGAGAPCLDRTSNPCSPGTTPDGGVAPDSQLGTRSAGCERLADSDLCLGEGWMLAEGESIPGCGESGAYRICTFETDACVSHTVMMVQRCD